MNTQRLLEALERMLAIVEAKIERDRKMMEQAIDMLDRSLRRLRKEYEAPQPPTQ
jgi:ABC-type phosphate transport system auxiliary subunit